MIKLSILTLTLLSTSFSVFAADEKASDAGKKTYDEACFACHNSGIAKAPKLGDADAWKDRIAKGNDALYETAIKGKGAMPPKGGRTDFSDDVIKAAVDYMLKTVQAK